MDSTSFDGGKYTIQLDNNTGNLKLLRYGEDWAVGNVHYSKIPLDVLPLSFIHFSLKIQPPIITCQFPICPPYKSFNFLHYILELF